MTKNGSLNICQPGNGVSCALCCGSHNFKASPAEIKTFLIKRTEQFNRRKKIFLETFGEKNRHTREVLFRKWITSNPFSESVIPKLYRDGIQCPFIGYIDPHNSIPGCLLYPDTGQPDLRTSAHQKICEHFSCVAKDILTDDEITFAAALMDDWFYYSLLIHEITLLKDMHKKYKYPAEVPEGMLRAIRRALLVQLYHGESAVSSTPVAGRENTVPLTQSKEVADAMPLC
jgi:hypothetical protein